MRNWRTRSARACVTISLLAAAAAAAPQPAIVLIDAGDKAQWQSWISGLPADSGWQIIAPAASANTPIDERVEAIEAAAREAVKSGSADPLRLYLAGRNEAAAAVFYTISRAPDLWAAGVALGSSPEPAIDTGRIYSGNFALVPVLWAGKGDADRALAGKLAGQGLKIEWRSGDKLSVAGLFEWLGSHARPEFPAAIDCETSSPTFASCYWIRMTKLDAAERNDVLPSTRIAPAIKPALDLGAFGYKIGDPGPGILISTLPEKYSGRLKIGDRIIELNGRPIADARGYAAMMAEFREEKPVAVMVQRGKEKFRIETNVVLATRAPEVTARVQASYDAAAGEIQIVSRAVTGMQVTAPARWMPCTLNWNGAPVGKLEGTEGTRCFALRIEKELENMGPCGADGQAKD
ncbi:MAG TPA: hypothetical protein VKV17_02660 [Bryobacteraceae bacterium]|nr:hypothetical protein [Bryobacteraceae bacterium]